VYLSLLRPRPKKDKPKKKPQQQQQQEKIVHELQQVIPQLTEEVADRFCVLNYIGTSETETYPFWCA
jgi:hypothetical protein